MISTLTSAPSQRPTNEAKPDLVVSDLAPDTYFPFPGEDVYFDVTVTNQGTADAPAFDVRLSGFGVDDTERSAGLAAGASQSYRMGPLRVDPWTQLYWVDANADTGHEVAEANERNNWRTVVLHGPRPPQPPQPPIPPIPIPPRVLLAE